jgi:hypothetical protein
MPNPHRGEIEACLDGKSFRLCLTLSALAELEHAFNNDDMLALAERFQNGRLSARDAQRIIGAGLRGAGNDIADDAVGRMQTEGGAAGFVDIVARLLSATFAGPVAPLVGAIAGEIVSGLAETKSASPESPSPVHAEHGSDTTRGGVRGGGRTSGRGKAPDANQTQECRAPVPFPGTT